MNLIFLQNSATQPRCHKRFRAFKQAGVEGVVYSFNRNWYNVNLPQDIKINSLGDLAPGSYFKRIFLYIRKLRPIFQQHKDAIFYCYGQDMAFVAMVYGKKYVYEESDIMYLEYESSLIRSLMKRLDLYIQKKAIACVFTSQGFVDYLYDKRPEKVFVLPNKLDSYFEDKPRPHRTAGDVNALRFSFIGLLRYERMMKAFIKVMVERSPKHEFNIWGDGGDIHKSIIQDLVHAYPQVHYHGPFRNPIDLESIYAQTDINFVCYDTTGGNECIAEPNKLYESIFFNTPILVSPNTYLAKVVHMRGTGFIVDCDSEKGINEFFDALTEEELNGIIEACNHVEKSQIIDNTDTVKVLLTYMEKA